MKRKIAFRKNEGITLITLVVTIIVLIILATVSINIVLGDNGLINMAKKAKDIYGNSEKIEQEYIEEVSREMYEMYSEGADDETPGELTGEGSEQKPYLIQSIEDLVEFSKKVSEGDTFDEKVVRLGVNLDFKSDSSYVNLSTTKYGDINENRDDSEGLKQELTMQKGFKPIGNSTYKFNGTFDGGNHTLSNLYISSTESSVGLFGEIDQKSNIKNLILLNANVKSEKNCVGILVGLSYGKIENIQTNGGTVEGLYDVGGISGVLKGYSSIDSCINNTSVTSQLYSREDNYESGTGGISGICYKDTRISNSCNLGSVNSNKGSMVGGITGFTIGSVVSCYNKGTIGNLNNGENRQYIGGIIGDCNGGTVIGCFNAAPVMGTSSVGGIVGYSGYQSTIKIENCYNTGEISGIKDVVSGITSIKASCTGGYIKNCYNVGNITIENTSAPYCGAIAGNELKDNSNFEISNCYYLTGTYKGGINGEDQEGKAEKKEYDYMHKIDFVTTLNKGTSIWKQDMNGGYPILDWQEKK